MSGAESRFAALSGIRERHAIGHQPTSNPLYCAENDGLSAVYCEVGFLLAALDRERETLRIVATSLEGALTPTGDHRALPDGYCPDCGGGCMRGMAEANAETIRNAAYAGPSPFEVKP